MATPLFFDGAVPLPEQRETRNTHEVLASMCGLLEELLAEVKRSNSTERTGSVSSLAIEDTAKTPRVSSKFYVGSPLTRGDVDDALAIHGYLHAEAERRALDGWAETVAALANGTPA